MDDELGVCAFGAGLRQVADEQLAVAVQFKAVGAAGTAGDDWTQAGLPDFERIALPSLCAQDAQGRHAALERCLADCTRGAWQLSDLLAGRYFTHSVDALRHSVGM